VAVGESGSAGADGVRGPIVVLAGPGAPTNIVANYLARRFSEVVVIVEDPVPRLTLARRRARRLGWPTVLGQVAFVTVALPLLRRAAQARITDISTRSGLDTSDIGRVLRVTSVNDPGTVELLRELSPAVVVVQGTRIISDIVLTSVPAPFINIHAGITPRYRGVHGGYWALAEGRPDLAGTTVHVVDAGIDTGGVLARAYFAPEPADSIATYPYRHLADGLPLLVDQVGRVLGGDDVRRDTAGGDLSEEPSVLRWHPTLWGYIWTRITKKVR
jgi:folate-dependent phosphoribosylglycinamide formyltransferase PurN